MKNEHNFSLAEGEPASPEELRYAMNDVADTLDNAYIGHAAVSNQDSGIAYTLDAAQLEGSSLAGRYNHVSVDYNYIEIGEISEPAVTITLTRFPKEGDGGMHSCIALAQDSMTGTVSSSVQVGEGSSAPSLMEALEHGPGVDMTEEYRNSPLITSAPDLALEVLPAATRNDLNEVAEVMEALRVSYGLHKYEGSAV